jgi:hypothetical protein
MIFKVEIDEKDIAILRATLPEHTYKLVASLIAKLDSQIQSQSKPRIVGMTDGIAEDESGTVMASTKDDDAA